jgi:type I restriction enzyme S subunit
MSWDKKKLTEICKPKQWKIISQSELTETGYVVYGANGIMGCYHEFNHETPVLLIGCRGSCGSIHISQPFSYTNGNAMACDELSSEVDINFLKYFLEHRGFDDIISGGVQKQITIQGLNRIEIPLPPLATQKRIAEILDAADVLRRKDQELLKKYDELAQAIFIDMFGDPVKNEKGWEVIKLENVCNKITDGEHINPEIVPEGKPLIMAKDIRFEGVDFSDYKCVSENDFIKFTKKCNPQKGDLILVSRGATIGRCCVVDTDKEFCIMGSTILIKANQDLNTSYLNQLFKIENFKNKLVNVSSASAQQAIYISHVKELNIPIPPIEKQLNFHERLRAIKNQIIKSSDVMNQSNFLFNSLIQKAFKGELVQTVKQTQC